MEVSGLAPASDGGVVMGVRDDLNAWSLQKRDASGALVWVYRFQPQPGHEFYSIRHVVASPDGDFTVFGSSGYQIRGGAFTSVTAQKIDRNGALVWYKTIRFSDTFNSVARQVIGIPDGGYLLVGNIFPLSVSGVGARAWAAKLDEQGNTIWQKQYEERALLDDVILNPYFNGSFIASGVNNLNAAVTNTLNIGPDGDPGGGYNQPGRVSDSGTLSALVAVPATNGKPAFHTVLDNTNQNGGDFRLINLAQSDQLVWTKTLGGSGNDVPQDIIITDDGGYLVIGTTTSTDGDVQGKTNTNPATWIVKLKNAVLANALTVTQPTYNCSTGTITFNTSGGDGSPITYNAPGISRSSPTSNTGTIEPGLRNDPKPITITATQSGNTVSYIFDLKAACNGTQPPVNPPTPPVIPPTGGTLALTTPTYNCQTGAITFNTSGGDGSSIEYAVAGITGWTTNPNQFVDRDSRTASDVQPFTLMARQNGVMVSYVWDLKAACGRARIGVGERVAELSVSVLGNPVSEAVTVAVRGAEGQPLSLRLIDGRGRIIESRLVEQAGVAEQQRFDLRQVGPGLLLLRVSSSVQAKTVKIVKQ